MVAVSKYTSPPPRKVFHTLTAQAESVPSRISASAESQRRRRTTASASGSPSSTMTGVEKASAPRR